jgi:hypothetical protein
MKVFTFIVMSIMLVAATVNAGQFEMEVNYMASFDPNKELSYTSEIPEIKLVWKLDNNIRLWGAYQKDHMDWVGAYSYDLDVFSGGVGYEKEWNDVHSTYVDGGVAILNATSVMGNSHEGQSYYQASLLPWAKYRQWDNYTFNPEPAIVIVLGNKIEPWENIGINIGARAMIYEFNIQGKNDGWKKGCGYWTFDQDGVQLSAFVGVYFRY